MQKKCFFGPHFKEKAFKLINERLKQPWYNLFQTYANNVFDLHCRSLL